ncbi:retropepsin-like aspartic protease [Streptomyces sp. CC219B]|uniref:retropepsin-like aspartic protease n=1 Tax=Streptomyces sp. CC219B TaxID=3044574 RepID=UPI0024A8399A|nr:retropepsin-like aspartic protease [Streptomyces sp. CC219B]
MSLLRRCTAGWAALCVTAALATGCTDGSAGSGASPEGEEGTRRVSLTVVESGGQTLVLVPVTVKGEGPYTFVLDTGASASVVDDDLARELDLARTGERRPVSGVVGTGRVPVVEVPDWRMGRVSLAAADLAVIDLPQAPGARSLHGLLGSDVLSDFGRITVDYDKETLSVPSR